MNSSDSAILAFGTVDKDGNRISGSPNWSSRYNAPRRRYEIEIEGEDYYFPLYTTHVSVVDSSTYFYTVASHEGKLVVAIVDRAGDAAQKPFSFTVVRDPGQTPNPSPQHEFADDTDWAEASPEAFRRSLGQDAG